MTAAISLIRLPAARVVAQVFGAAALTTLAACGGGDDSGGVASAPQVMHGTAAMGDFLVGAKVTVTDAQGKTASTVTNELGQYEIPLNGLAAPLLVTAEDANGDDPTLYSVLPELPADEAQAVVNVSVVTSALVSELSEHGNPAELASAQTLARRVTPASVDATVARLNQEMGPILAAAGENAVSYNPIHQRYLLQPTGVFGELLKQLAPTVGSAVGALGPGVGPLLPFMVCGHTTTRVYATRVDLGRSVVDLTPLLPSVGAALQGSCGNSAGNLPNLLPFS